ncbi:MAG: Hsp20 family protein [Bacteroidota bacterium]|nr:Hsp20 family protein [Bacteroidota bacterium]
MLPVFKSRNLPGIFDEFFNSNLLPNYIEEGAWKSTPAVNIYENNEKFEIEIAAPGLEKEDFKIDLKDEYLTVYSEKKDKTEEKEKGKSFVRNSGTLRSSVHSLCQRKLKLVPLKHRTKMVF